MNTTGLFPQPALEYDAGAMRVLLVEDNQKLASYMREMLEHEGYAVDAVFDGATGERMARGGSYDLVILDIMLPEKDGISVCRSLRDEDFVMPIIMVTARDAVGNRIEGLDSGADDYLVKPFDMQELLARVRALLRRPQQRVAEVLTLKDLLLDTATRTLTKDGAPIPLSPKEYAVLDYLMRNKGRVISRDELLAHCWDFAYDPESNITDVYIRQLRRKLQDTNETYIETKRGAGYQCPKD